VIWHLGNRHVPTEITSDAVYIVEDHVLVDMVRGLGAAVTPVQRPFGPERGAYDHGDHAFSHLPHAEVRGEAEPRSTRRKLEHPSRLAALAPQDEGRG
jgi:hypothetical protein